MITSFKTSPSRATATTKTTTTTTTIPFYRDSLCSKIIADSWPQLSTGLQFTDKVPPVNNLTTTGQNTALRPLSYAPQFPYSNTLSQAVFQGKPSFMKRIIKAIANPMKTLASRKNKHLAGPSNKGSGFPTNGKAPQTHPESDDTIRPSHDTTRNSSGKRGFNDMIGYRMFRKDSLCVEDC